MGPPVVARLSSPALVLRADDVAAAIQREATSRMAAALPARPSTIHRALRECSIPCTMARLIETQKEIRKPDDGTTRSPHAQAMWCSSKNGLSQKDLSHWLKAFLRSRGLASTWFRHRVAGAVDNAFADVGRSQTQQHQWEYAQHVVRFVGQEGFRCEVSKFRPQQLVATCCFFSSPKAKHWRFVDQ